MTTTIGSLDLNTFNDLYSDSNQYFWFESNSSATYGAGAHVTLVPDTTFISNPTGQNILMNTDGISIRNGLLPMMTLDNNSLDFNMIDTVGNTYTNAASFGISSTIGLTDGTQSYLYEDYHSLQMIDKEGDIYFHISDLRDKNGRINNEYIGDGATTTFPLFVECLYLYQVMVNDTVVYDYYTHQTSSCSYDDYSFTFLTMTPNVDDVIKVSYLPRYPSSAKAYTLGKTDTSELGGYSLREGVGTEASGYCSHAEGIDTVASGWYSHSEGGRNKASGVCSHAEGGGYRPSASSVQMLANNASGGGSHAEGYGTTASGDFSHAEGNLTTASGKGSHSGGLYTTASGDYSNANGTKTVANYENQFVIGAYNDNKSNNAFEIGNSSSGGFRSNALEVDWQGNVVASGDITDGSGNLLANMPYVDTKANMTFAKVTQALADGKSVFMFDGELMYAYVSHDTTNDYYWFSRSYGHSGFQRWRLDSSDVWTDEGITNFADYVIEQGTSGIWRYRKWNSGVYECFGTQTASIAVTTASVGYGGYRSGSLSIPAFPITFIGIPTVTATVGSGSQGCWVNNVQPTTTGGSYYLSSGASSPATNRNIQFQAMGRWK